MKKSGMRIK